MFDIGFTEILVIATITLIVIGPERLPETVRGVSLWIGRLKRSLRETRREIEQQIGADEIRRELHNEEVLRSLEKVRTDVSETLTEDLELEHGFANTGQQRPAQPERPAIDLAETSPTENRDTAADQPGVDDSPANSKSAGDRNP